MNLVHITSDVIVDKDSNDKAFSPLLSSLAFDNKIDYDYNTFKVASFPVQVCDMNETHYDAVLISFTEEDPEDTMLQEFEILLSQNGNYISNTSFINNI